VQRRDAVLAFWGGRTGPWMDWMPFIAGAAALTLGHVILGRDEATVEDGLEHELVHVRQYERWGPFFVPAYLLCSAALRLRGKHPYYDNPFEREAYLAVRSRRPRLSLGPRWSKGGFPSP
jgi:hypothetical protein